MLIKMATNATKEQIQHVVERIRECGFQPHLSEGEERTVIGVVGKSDSARRSEVEALRATPGVDEIIPIANPFKLASRTMRPEGSILDLGKGVTIGGTQVIVGAGPCAVESAPQILEVAGRVAAADQHDLLVVSEVMDPSQVELMVRYVDVLQVGARNMQNYYLLRALGEIQKPILLKRGMSATIEELLLSAEYIMSG